MNTRSDPRLRDRSQMIQDVSSPSSTHYQRSNIYDVRIRFSLSLFLKTNKTDIVIIGIFKNLGQLQHNFLTIVLLVFNLFVFKENFQSQNNVNFRKITVT